MKMNEWVTEKPEFNEECLVIVAVKIRNDWEYTVYQVKLLDDEGGWYWGLLTGDLEEWGDINDMIADKYLVMPLLN